jgi:hypothetical protein
MDAMLDPRMVAASTHLPEVFLAEAVSTPALVSGVIAGGFPIRAIKP